MKDILTYFGLSDNEIELYLRLLELGSATSGQLMKELGLYSKTVYELLDKLMQKGLVSFVIKSNTRHFEAAHPHRFLGIIAEERDELDNKEKEIIKIIPELEAKRKMSTEPQEATIYKGNLGMKSIFNDAIKEKNEVLVFGGGGKFQKALGPYAELWHRQRKKHGIPIRVLWNEAWRGRKHYLDRLPLTLLRFLPKEYDNAASAMVYGDKVAIIVWSDTPIATLIRSKEVAKSYKGYFDMLWKIGKR